MQMKFLKTVDRNFSDVLKTIVQSFFKYNQPYKWHVSAKFHDRCYPHGVNDNDLAAIKRETLSFPATIQFGVLKYTSNSFRFDSFIKEKR